jgi:hypothetical protein
MKGSWALYAARVWPVERPRRTRWLTTKARARK